MTRTRKKTAQGAGRGKRRLLTALLLTVAAILITAALTEPRQLPARIADHTLVRTIYAWRDTTQGSVHRAIYPLSTLRQEDASPARTGVGYDKDDRKALDVLLKSKENIAP